ncbi:HEAT repeat domain-containing protein [Anaeromyxobacter paludicola]|uniref:HEAT repeat domain-containing protein n=1 Tax=Anaeromyxobacter paludicola TaxID=2918171 RepID=A0ABM7X799_9BACT|nr:HEAT repeat domain-containing protein [Anaeromyxobacter paludicola]BDG07722.1 hypothetical protein AMPC_08350 [Anaeromyxobacter paludicola]
MARPAALVVALGLLLCGGCRRAPHLGLERVVVSQSAAGDRLLLVGVGAEAVREAARQALLGAGFEPLPASGEAARDWRPFFGRAAVLASAAEPGAAGSVAVVVELEASPADGDEPALRARARGASAPEPGEAGLGPAFRRALASALGGAAQSIALDLLEERKSDRDLLADLRSPERRVRDSAVRALADRKNAAAVPGLIERLRDDDPELVERAVGALGQLGDERAVDPLIELSLRRGPELTARLARVIGDLGGVEAQAYLLTVASGHPDEGVRVAAAEALGEARSRAAARGGAAGR